MPTRFEPAAGTHRRRGGAASFLLAASLGFFAADFLQPPRNQVGAQVALSAIDAYRATVSPLLARAHISLCRFQPSCSAYGREAVARYGLPKGLWLAGLRLLRCHPFAKGGADPVP